MKPGVPARPLIDRLTERIRGPWADPTVAPADCWLWTGAWRSRFGYGRLRLGGHNSRSIQAHLAFYELVTGTRIPPDRIGCHSCNQPLCCNPDHLYPGTFEENYRDQLANGYENHGRRGGLRRKAA